MNASQIYTPLNSSRDEIRVLEAIPTQPTAYKLRIVSLQDKPDFCAISYRWDSSPASQKIKINDIDYNITTSLGNVLADAKVHWQSHYPNRSPELCRLWVDAICINQKDTEEKNFQVPLMASLYSSAEATFCFLDAQGLVSESLIGSAMDIIEIVSKHVIESRNQFIKRGHESIGTWAEDHVFKLLHEVDLEWVAKYSDLFQASPNRQHENLDAHPSAVAISAFLDLCYWKRVWIFQELVLSKRPLLIHHYRSIEFSKVLDVIELSLTLKKRVAGSEKIQLGLSIGLEGFHALFYGLSYVKTSRRERAHMPPEVQTVSASHIQVTSIMHSKLQATNPKDHVYALLGVTGLDLATDYSDKKSLASVYIDFCQATLVASKNIPRLHCFTFLFLQDAGAEIEDETRNIYDLPSWVPNFPRRANSKDGELYQRAHLFSDNKRLTERCDWKNNFEWLDKVSICGRSLFAPAVIVSSLASLTPPLTKSFSSHIPFISSLFDLIGSQPLGGEHRHPLLSLVGALGAEDINVNIWESDEVITLVELLADAQFLAHGLGFSMPEFTAIYGDDLPGPVGSLSFATKFLRKLGFEPDEMMDFGREISITAHKTAQDWIWRLMCAIACEAPMMHSKATKDWLIKLCFKKPRISITTENEFAVVPHSAAEGDLLVSFVGSNDFYLVRELKDGHYIYLGECGYSKPLANIVDAVCSGEAKIDVLELR